MIFAPQIGIALLTTAALVVAGRHSQRALQISGALLLVLSTAIWLLHPSVTTHPNPPAGPAGFETWPLPIAVAAVFVLVAIWRKYRKPGMAATLLALITTFVISTLGSWVA